MIVFLSAYCIVMEYLGKIEGLLEKLNLDIFL